MLSANGSFTFVYPKGIPQCMPLRGGEDFVRSCILMQRNVAYLPRYVAEDCRSPFSYCTITKKLVELVGFLYGYKREDGELTMDEVMGAGARELPVHGLVGVFAVLLGIILIIDQTFWVKMESFLDSPLVPAVEIQDADFGKVQGRVLYRENEGIEHEMGPLLEAAVIPKDFGMLLKDAVPAPTASEHVLSKYPPAGEDAAALQSVVSGAAEPQVEETGYLTVESKLPETMMPAPEEPSVIVPEYLPDTTVIVEEIISNLPEPEEIVPENPSDLLMPSETVAEDLEKPSTIVSEQQPETPISKDVTMPAPVEPEVIVPEKPAEEPSIPEPVIPDTETSDSEMTDDVPADAVEEEGKETVPVSCFLLDEAGMLYGFLPEYAESADGYLALPAECTGIRSGAFSGCGAGIVELYIPAGAAVIEGGAFYGLDNLEWIEVEAGNPGYASELGILFDSSMSVLMKFPCGRVGTYLIPPNVTMVADRAFEGTSLGKLDVRNCPDLSINENAFGYSAGNGIEIIMPETQF